MVARSANRLQGDWQEYLVRPEEPTERGEAATNSGGPTAINSDMSCGGGGKVKHRRLWTDGRTGGRTWGKVMNG